MTQTKTSISTLKRFFDFKRPFEYEFDIEEIAHALSNLCRYTGHVHSFYSVAEHSVLCSWAVSKEYAKEALLHDASEAFCGDVSKPLKAMLPEYQKIEDDVQLAIARHFKLRFPFPKEIHDVDAGMYWAEREGIARSAVIDTIWNKQSKTVPFIPRGWTPYEAKEIFLERFYEIDRDEQVLRQRKEKAAA